MRLSIDTTKLHEIHVAVSNTQNNQVLAQTAARNQFGSQQILPLIAKLLADQHVPLTELTAITVSTASESFTGMRVGIAIANALGYAQNIPVNNKILPKQIVTPAYETPAQKGMA